MPQLDKGRMHGSRDPFGLKWAEAIGDGTP